VSDAIPPLSMDATIAPVQEAWLVTGIPGSGKSTVSRLLAETFKKSVHIEGDRLQEWIASGAVWPGQDPVEEANRQIALNRRNQCLLARSFADAGFVPVIDYVVVSRSLLADYQRLLAGLYLRLVVLAPGRDVALQRDRDRAEKTVAAFWAFLEDELNRDLGDLGLWIDSRHQRPEQTVAEILARAGDAALPPGAISTSS
jgi:predicted ATPase